MVLPRASLGRLAAPALIATRSVRGKRRSPFAAGAEVPLLLHASHHKCGTVWFLSVLKDVAEHYGLAFEARRYGAGIADGTRVVMYEHPPQTLDGLPPFRGSHIIRDPRDAIVSGYHYHLWSEEWWLHDPQESYGGVGFQDHLRSLSMEQGLMAEIRWAATYGVREMTDWDYHDPRFLELRYEDAMRDKDATFDRLFRHYGFSPEAADKAVYIARRSSFDRVARRAAGTVKEGSHLRSGKAGQWREVLTQDHLDLLDHLTDNAPRRLGYDD